MYAEINAAIADGIQSVDALLKSRIEEKQRDPSKVSAASWKEEESVRSSVTILKDIAKLLSNGCIKLILLIRAKPSDVALASLLGEMTTHSKLFIGHYFQFLEHSVAECLFDSVTRAVRTLLSHIQDFLGALQSGSTDTLNYMVGMVTKISDEMVKIPLSNKQAYRTLFMQNCLLVKDTLQEFKAYLEEAREKQTRRAEQEAAAAELPATVLTGVANIALSAQGIEPESAVAATAEDVENSDEEDADSDEDEDDLDYTPAEVAVVEAATRLLAKTIGCIKHTLFIATTVCDALCTASITTASTAAPTTAPSASTCASGVTASPEAVQYSQRWVAQLAHLTQLLNKDALDLGAELYPPFESDLGKIEATFDTLRSHCLDYLRLVDVEALRALQTADHAAKISELSAEVTACTLSI